MKQYLKKTASLLCVLCVLTGCIRVVNEVGPSGSGNMDISSGSSTEDAGTAGDARSEEENTGAAEADDAAAGSAEDASEETAEDDADVKVRLTLFEDTFDEVKHIGGNDRFAVRNDTTWGVVDATGREVFAPEYDYIETDGDGLFSLTQKDGDSYFNARLMYYDAKSGEEEEVFSNEQYPEYDFTEFYKPYITMTTRGTDKLNVMFVEADHAGLFDFSFYRLSKFDRNAILNAGMDAGKWGAVSGFMGNMTSDGGSFVDSKDWVPVGAGYSNAVGIDGNNQIVLSEIERNRTIRMMPYAADDAGNYTAYLVDLPSENETPAYGSLNEHDITASGLKEFPSGTVEVIPDMFSGTARAGRSGRAVIADADHNEAIFNMSTGKAETEFKYRSILLSGDNRYPSVAREDQAFVYITPDGETRDAGEAEYTGASLYDEAMGYALVIDKDGNLYAIDRSGNRVSAKEEGFDEGTVTYLNGEDSHTFLVETNGKVRICVLQGEN